MHAQQFWISLPADNNSTFHVSALLNHLNECKRDYIALGEPQAPISKHTQRPSLDHWLRSQFDHPAASAAATQQVLKQLCDTGLFKMDQVPCPDTQTTCMGLRVIEFL